MKEERKRAGKEAVVTCPTITTSYMGFGFPRKQARNDWFDEEREKMRRGRTLPGHEPSVSKPKVLQTRIKKNFLATQWGVFNRNRATPKHSGHPKFYKRLNDVRRLFEAQVTCTVAGEGAEQDQPPNLNDKRDNGVGIDLSSLDEIKGAMKYWKNNGSAGSDSIAAELLKNGGKTWWMHYTW
jgi:hypothetical protein